MNFFFGQIHGSSMDEAGHNQLLWLNKTIFGDLHDCISTHVEDGFSITLINDPKQISPYQSKSIYVDDDFVCTSDCQLFNKVELSEKLNIDVNSSNEEFFISAYRKWGNEFPDNFDGKFSFVIWNRKKKVLLCGLDHLGYGNFSYSQIDNDFYFASDLATLLDQKKIDKSINMKRFYQCFRYSNNTPEQSYFQHCYYCPPSHVLKVEKNIIEAIDYWRLADKTPFKDKKNEITYAKEFISLLRDALKKEVGPNSKLGLMLSGGYDSSLLAAILAENLNWKNNLTCYSYTFEKFKSCDESKYINQTLEQLDLNGKLINCDDKTIFSDLKNRFVTKDLINLDAYSSLPETLYSRAHEDKRNILISGLNGDDIFGGVRYMYADLLRRGNFLTILKSILSSEKTLKQLSKLVNFGIRPLLPKSLKSLYRFFVRVKDSSNTFNVTIQDINSVAAEKLLNNSPLFHHQKLLKLIYYRNSPEGLHFIRKRLYLKHQLEFVMPYYNKQLIEFMWSIPLELLEKNGVYRGVQINALELFKLTHIATRLDKTTFEELIKVGIRQNHGEIKAIYNNSLLVNEKILQDNFLNKMKKTTENADNIRDSMPAVFFTLTEIWWRELKNSNSSFNNNYQC